MVDDRINEEEVKKEDVMNGIKLKEESCAKTEVESNKSPSCVNVVKEHKFLMILAYKENQLTIDRSHGKRFKV